jgi:hypothetical protein
MTFVRPGRHQTFRWRDLTRFVIDEEMHERSNSEKHVERNVLISVVIDAGPERQTLRIAAGDFAERLPGNPRERAERFCTILNGIREWATAADAAAQRNALSARLVSGLVVAPAYRDAPAG